MAYNLYQVQMARAWVERCDKENAQAEKFWTKQALQNTQAASAVAPEYAGSVVTSAVPSGFTSKTTFLKTKLEQLEADLAKEQELRKKCQDDLEMLRKTGQLKS